MSWSHLSGLRINTLAAKGLLREIDIPRLKYCLVVTRISYHVQKIKKTILGLCSKVGEEDCHRD